MELFIRMLGYCHTSKWRQNKDKANLSLLLLEGCTASISVVARAARKTFNVT